MKEREFNWRTHVIAIDFDGCLCQNDYPDIGKPNEDVIEYAKRLQEGGACLILWTCRAGKDLDAAVEACRSWGLEFDAVNENPQFRIDLYGNDCRKIGADEYWDDKAVWMGDARSPVRNIRGACCEKRSLKNVRSFIDEALKPEIEDLNNRGEAAEGEMRNYFKGLAMVIREASEELEYLYQLLLERNEAHSWYKAGYKDATDNAAAWVSNMIEYMQGAEKTDPREVQ